MLCIMAFCSFVRTLERLVLCSTRFLLGVWFCLMRRCSIRTVVSSLHTRFYLVYQMTEGRLCQVQLLDNRKLELLVQPKLLSRELLDLVSSHFNLKEKQYFGLTFTDDTGQCRWLQMDHRVLEHDFCKKTGPIALNFLVRFYIESIVLLKDATTVELFFLNAKAAVYNGDIEVDSELVFKLAAHILQEANGDYTSDETMRDDLKKLPTLPTKVLQEHPSLAYCEERVMEQYRVMKGVSRGQAIVQYLTLVEALPTYGVHYYEVKDKQGMPWWLGISYKGIGQYDIQDKIKPRRLFQWKQLENLYFREKKFAVEVNDPHRRAVSKRTFGQTGLVIHTWYASHSLIKTIWVMAISQHQFYLEQKQSKAKVLAARSLEDIAVELTENGAKTSKLNLATKNQLIMASNGSLVSTGSADSEINDEQKKEKLTDLRLKEKEIQEVLKQRTSELKDICLREAELTGKLPKEYPMSAGEKPPGIRRRVGTSFKLDELFPYNEDPYLRNLESRFALQQKIVEAAQKLASEADIGKTVKKKRRRNCLDAMQKLQEIEEEMNRYRVRTGKRPMQRASHLITGELSHSECSSLSDGLLPDNDEITQRRRSRSLQCSPLLSTPSVKLAYDTERRSSESDTQLTSQRLHTELQTDYHHNPREISSAGSSPYKSISRRQTEKQNLAQDIALTRNAYSSSQLRCEESADAFRHRSGSLESQPPFHGSSLSHRPESQSRRSNSTEVLDDCSSCASSEFCPSTPPYLLQSSLHQQHSAGSMPNLVPHHAHPRSPYGLTPHYVSGYASADYEPYISAHANSAYVFESELEGHYNVNPSYPPHSYHVQEHRGNYGMMQNPYATLRPPRTKKELLVKSMQKALVVEHLRGWYNRTAAGRRAGCHHEYERGSQHNLTLGYQTLPAPFSRSSRTSSFSSVSSAASVGGAWLTNADLGRSEVDGDITSTLHNSCSGDYSLNPSSRFPECCPARRSDSLPHTSECVDVFSNDAGP